MVAYALDALAFCRSKLGDGYLAGGCRCETWCPTQDCSGLPVAACRVAGLWVPCINSSGFARWFREAGTIISFEEAIWTPFALMIRGPNGGEDGDGPIGHVMPCVGDGQHTYEAMGRRTGICVGSVFNRRVARCGKVPGLVYRPKPPPVPPFQLESTMIVQQFHYPQGKPVRIPDKFADGRWHIPTIGPSSDGKSLVLKDGASFKHPDGQAAGNVGADDIFVPPEINQHGGRVVGVARFVPQDGTAHILVVRFADNHESKYRLT